MKQERLNHDQFFLRLGQLFSIASEKGHGSVALTQKRLLPHSNSSTSEKKQDDLSDLSLSDTPGPILIRASNAKSRVTQDRKSMSYRKIKIATVVEPGDLDAFFLRYAETCKAGMTGLKKRDRKGKKQKRKKKAKSESVPAS